MASENRLPPDDLTWLDRLALAPGTFDFHAALRRVEASFPALPRLGTAVRPSEEPIRLGQSPSQGFEPSAVVDFVRPRTEGAVPRMLVGFMGLWGPQGPLPTHMTEHARERVRHVGDRTLTSFLDVFHHRMLLLFHRAWATTQPTVSINRPGDDSFAKYVGALVGMALPATQGRDAFPDRAKLFYAGRFGASARNAEGLANIVSDYFGVPADVESFVGQWVEVPDGGRWRLGQSPETGSLGRTAVLGARIWTRDQKFRLILGPLGTSAFGRMLPGARGIEELAALVRMYTNDEWAWDVRLVLTKDVGGQMSLGKGARLGWTSRVGRATGAREDLVVDPALGRTHRIQVKAGAS
jgi:type VI secretion system protein ImpH